LGVSRQTPANCLMGSVRDGRCRRSAKSGQEFVGDPSAQERAHRTEAGREAVRNERHRRGERDVGDADSSSRAARASATSATITSGVAGRTSMPPTTVDLMQPIPQPRRHSDVAATTADRPEQVGLALGVHVQPLAVGGSSMVRPCFLTRNPTSPPSVSPPIPRTRCRRTRSPGRGCPPPSYIHSRSARSRPRRCGRDEAD
jgi:hypothetical protein